jgi:transmembrane sensor
MTEQESAVRWWADVEEDPIHQAAAEWFIRLQDAEVSLEEVLAWQRWMGTDERHGQAFSRIESTYRTFGQIGTTAAGRTPTSHAADYDGSVSVSHWLHVQPARPLRHPRWVAIAATIVGLAVALAWSISGGFDAPWRASSSAAEIVQTVVGENRSTVLRDGSKVTLGGGTKIRVAFDTDGRHVELVRGEAFFTVAKDATRPFSVRAGDTVVTAVGTQFNVRRRNDRVLVAVVEGRVRVEPTPSIVPTALLRELRPKLAPVQVDAGQQTVAGDAGIGAAVSVPDAASTVSWQTGQLAFHGEPLRDVLEDVNRYSRKPIILGDEATGDLKITGTVLGADVEGWVASLEKAFAVEADEGRDRIVIRRRSAETNEPRKTSIQSAPQSY